MKAIKKFLRGILFVVAFLSVFFVPLFMVASCTDAQIASQNLSRAAEMFEVDRRIIFYNGITGDYMMTIEGRCAIEDQGNQLEVTCKMGEKDYRKHFLGLSDNVSYFAEQLSPGDVNAYHYRVVFKPQVIVPDFDFRVSGDASLDKKEENPEPQPMESNDG